MAKESDTSSYSSPPTCDRHSRKVRKTLEWSGFATFCSIQLILGVWSVLLLLLTVFNTALKNSLGVQFSTLLAVGGLVYLIISICNSFYYGKKAGKFTIPDRVLLTRFTSKKILKTVILSSLIGICLTFLGSTIITGVIFSKLMASQPLMMGCYEHALFIEAIDVILSQACISIMVAHCVGLVNSLWALNQIKK